MTFLERMKKFYPASVIPKGYSLVEDGEVVPDESLFFNFHIQDFQKARPMDGMIYTSSMPPFIRPIVIFTTEQLVEIKEIARIALQDALFFDRITDECDLSDKYLGELRDKLEKEMEESSK